MKIKYLGEDEWGRCVFKGENGRFYKTTQLNPREGFMNVPPEQQERIMETIHTTDAVDGEPGSPCWLSHNYEVVATL